MFSGYEAIFDVRLADILLRSGSALLEYGEAHTCRHRGSLRSAWKWLLNSSTVLYLSNGPYSAHEFSVNIANASKL